MWGKVFMWLMSIYGSLERAWNEQLHHMGYEDMGALAKSLAPSLKYQNLTVVTIIASNISVPIIKIFGLNNLAFAGLILTLALELLTGRWAAKVRGEQMESSKAIRFSFKAVFYLLIIFLSFQLAESYKERDNSVGQVLFDYAHLFFVAEIVYENWISIKENIGDLKNSQWLERFREKLKEKL